MSTTCKVATCGNTATHKAAELLGGFVLRGGLAAHHLK
jgi:hypothetical protein